MEGERILKSQSKELLHYGVLERSGRYPWGSGENPYQRLKDWRGYVNQLRRQGLSDEMIAKGSGMSMGEFRESLYSTTQRRSQTTIRNAEKRVADVAEVWRLKNKGYSNVAIGERMGIPESTVRNLLKPGADAKAKEILSISEMLRDSADSKQFVDIGVGVERYIGISKTKLDACAELLKEEGYNVYRPKAEQLGTGEETTFKVLCAPGVTYSDFMKQFNEDPSIVKGLGFYKDSADDSLHPIQKPTAISRDRIFVRYGDEGGEERDGLIQLRPGVEDIDLLGSRYAQVRISVDDKMYMKGMAVYSDDIPDGYDIVYNVNKKSGSPDEKVFKPMYEKGEDNPFGASTSVKTVDADTGEIVYQKSYIGKDGKQHLSALNIVNDQGSWDEWSKSLPSQMLSKQSVELAKTQLGIVSKSKKEELDAILALTNPTIKKKMLEEYADSCDSDAVHLKAAALPRQKTQVLIPMPSLKDNEIYAPNFKDGETVCLIRFPHGGTFEIPQLTVNNRNKEGIKTLGKAEKGLDAVGITKKVADQLSGADFDGDNVLVIPNNEGKLRVSDPLPQLRNFDPKISYKLPDDAPILDKNSPSYRTETQRTSIKNREMGVVSNLITDMTIKGASRDELARAVAHSMVVIDSVKHNLDWKQSEKDYGIDELKAKYQAGGGVSTIVSAAKSPTRVTKRREITSTSEMTKSELAAWKRGEKVYRDVEDATYTKRVTNKRTGEVTTVEKVRQTEIPAMMAVKNARELSSGSRMEEVYVEHANKLKSLANQARAAARKTPNLTYSPSAKKTYAAEVQSLDEKLDLAKKNAPLERQAVLISNAMLKAKIRSNPEIEKNADQLKKAKAQSLQYARDQVGANKKAVRVVVTDKEWDAIQAGAISDNKLREILNNTDMDDIKKRATPRESVTLTSTQVSRIKAMANNGLTQAEIAAAIGVSTSTVSSVL